MLRHFATSASAGHSRPRHGLEGLRAAHDLVAQENAPDVTTSMPPSALRTMRSACTSRSTRTVRSSSFSMAWMRRPSHVLSEWRLGRASRPWSWRTRTQSWRTRGRSSKRHHVFLPIQGIKNSLNTAKMALRKAQANADRLQRELMTVSDKLKGMNSDVAVGNSPAPSARNE